MSLVCLYSANCLWVFLYFIFRIGSFWDDNHSDQFDAVADCVWALMGWLPTPSTNASNAGSNHASIFKRLPLVMTLSMCSQLLWSIMARFVLSGTCSVKLLYGLGHHVAAQLQGVGNILQSFVSLVSNKLQTVGRCCNFLCLALNNHQCWLVNLWV